MRLNLGLWSIGDLGIELFISIDLRPRLGEVGSLWLGHAVGGTFGSLGAHRSVCHEEKSVFRVESSEGGMEIGRLETQPRNAAHSVSPEPSTQRSEGWRNKKRMGKKKVGNGSYL